MPLFPRRRPRPRYRLGKPRQNVHAELLREVGSADAAQLELQRQLANHPLLGGRRPRHRLLADQLWEHSAHVAALAHVLARRVTKQDPETALFAGVVHEVGAFYLLSRAKDYPCLLEEPPVVETAAGAAGGDEDEGEEEATAEGNGKIGEAVLKKLSVPEKVVGAIEVLWKGYLALPPSSLGDTLLLADLLAPVHSPLRQMIVKEGQGRHADIDMTIGADTLSGILQESADEVESMIVALRF